MIEAFISWHKHLYKFPDYKYSYSHNTFNFNHAEIQRDFIAFWQGYVVGLVNPKGQKDGETNT